MNNFMVGCHRKSDTSNTDNNIVPIVVALSRQGSIVCARQHGHTEKEHSQNSVLLITLYVEYSSGNCLFSSIKTNVHGFSKLDKRIRSPASKSV